MFYDKESDFEDDLVAVLKRHGWTDGVLEYPTEQDLIDNWANILFDNNKGIDRLNGQRLTKGEMAQILEQIETLRTPLALNSFINGKTVSIKRDNPADTAHFGKEISLKILRSPGNRRWAKPVPNRKTADVSGKKQNAERS